MKFKSMSHVCSVCMQTQNLPLRGQSLIFYLLVTIKSLLVQTTTTRLFLSVRKSKPATLALRLWPALVWGESKESLVQIIVGKNGPHNWREGNASRSPKMLRFAFPLPHGETEITNWLLFYWNRLEFYGAESRMKTCKTNPKPIRPQLP